MANKAKPISESGACAGPQWLTIAIIAAVPTLVGLQQSHAHEHDTGSVVNSGDVLGAGMGAIGGILGGPAGAAAGALAGTAFGNALDQGAFGAGQATSTTSEMGDPYGTGAPWTSQPGDGSHSGSSGGGQDNDGGRNP